jgi:putative ABC transport system permease protein
MNVFRLRRATYERLGSAASRLRASDLLTLGSAGIRAKPARAILSALGIAIGVAAMVAVLGISASSQARLNDRLAALGTNLLSATAAPPTSGDPIPMPVNATSRLARLPGIEATSSVADLPALGVYRNSYIDPGRTGGLTVTATELNLLDVVAGTVRSGAWLNEATSAFPTTVLGASAAQRLGVTEPGSLVWLGGKTAVVVGILDPVPLAPELDIAALIGLPVAGTDHAFAGNPTKLYQRVDEASIEQVRTLIGPAVQPAAPAAVAVSRPSDALAAISAVDETFTGMLVGLGSIALLVGAIGVANTMVISVIERRREIGLRRALGATRRHIRLQFLTEALVLSAIGGVAGAGLGYLVTLAVALASGWPPVVPLLVLAAGVVSTLAVGAIAGLYPAIRAARTPPTAALNS